MIQFIVVSSFFLQDYISFIFLLVFFFVVFSFGVVVVLIFGVFYIISKVTSRPVLGFLLMDYGGQVDGDPKNDCLLEAPIGDQQFLSLSGASKNDNAQRKNGSNGDQETREFRWIQSWDVSSSVYSSGSKQEWTTAEIKDAGMYCQPLLEIE